MNLSETITQEKKKVLMHVCCGPCAEWPHEALQKEGFEVDAYFYNPNIQPQAELNKRLENMRKMAKLHGIKLYEESQSMEAYWRSLEGKTKNEHCRICYSLRLNEAARFAKQHGYQYLTTSLQVSPFQDQNLIRQIAMQVCRNNGIEFIERPFFESYRLGQEMAKSDELYRQKYCGCIYSLNETNPKFKQKLLKEFALLETDLPVREP